MRVTRLPEGRTPLLVASHERSGTHFTMNALAAGFGYVSAPWVDLDHASFNINYFDAPSLTRVIRGVAAARPANLVKSHHAYEFFADVLPHCRGEIACVYVHRHPADVMASYWRFLHSWRWTEGPRAGSVLDLARSAPMGRLMRLQYRQQASMLDRWADHVRGWLDAAARSREIHVLRYEELDQAYAETLGRLGAALGMEPRALERPSRSENVIVGGDHPFDPPPDWDDRTEVAALALQRHPELMDRLGYGVGAGRAGNIASI